MGSLDYLAKAAGAWFVGFAPFFEIYVAVPGAIAVGLDYVSAVIWPVLGNFTPVLLIAFFYDQLSRVEGVDRLLERRSPKLERWINAYGPWFILLTTPWIGVWVVATTAQLLGIKRGPLLFYSFVSITVYAVAIAFLIALGIEVFTRG
jgi:uncharacterized membrane protein